MADEGRSAWAYVGLGCLALAVVGVLATAGGGFWLYRGAKRFEAEIKDPAARTSKVLEVLGASELPAGYHAVVAFSVPFVMRFAILSDRPPDSTGQVRALGQRGLIYIEFLHLGQDEQALGDYFAGRTDDPRVLRDNKIKIDVDEIIGRGVLERPDATLLYVSQRGTVAAHGFSGHGITSVILVDCPDDARMRTAIWFGPDSAPGKTAGAPELVGTPADPAAIGEFMGNFRFCGKPA